MNNIKVINLISLFILFIFQSCENKSKVVFDEECYGRDTVFATLKFNIVDKCNNKPLKNINVTIYNSNDLEKNTFSDEELKYYTGELFFPKVKSFILKDTENKFVNFLTFRHLNLRISKKDYRTLFIKNFGPNGGYLYNIDIELAKGFGVDTFEINK